MRKIIQSILQLVLGVAFVAGGVMLAQKLAGSKQPPPKSSAVREVTVTVVDVQNQEIPIEVNATGALQAVDRVELFSEVQGVMLPDGGKFKPGTAFNKGEVLLAMNADDLRAELQAQRSNLQTLITGALADLRMDFPEAFPKWQAYAQQMDVDDLLKDLPEATTDQEKRFITGRNIITTFYNIRNAEIRLGKYVIRAPFDGVLTEAMVNPGTVIRPGQPLGVFIQPGHFEMEAPVSAAMVDGLQVGQRVSVRQTSGGGNGWNGTIARINPTIDPATLTMNVYIRLQGKGLAEGMYVEGHIAATSVTNAMRLPREMLFDSRKLYITDGEELHVQQVEPVHFSEQSVVVRGLEEGTQVLTRMPPSAYPGLKVKEVLTDPSYAYAEAAAE